MTDAQLTQCAEEIFPMMAQFIEGEPTIEKIEHAFYAYVKRQNELRATYLEDKEFRASVHDMMFESALEQVNN